MNDDLIIIKKTEITDIIESSIRRILKPYIDNIPKVSIQKSKLNVQGVAALSGYKPNTIYRLVHENKIPYHKPLHGGRKLVFYINEIESWLEGKNAETTDEYCERMENKLFSK